MKAYSSRITDLKPISGCPARFSHIVFKKDHKSYVLIHSVWVPACCGAKFFISDTAFPDDLLESIAKAFIPSGMMLIFIMPKLPKKAKVLADGIGVINQQRERPQQIYNLHLKLTKSPYYTPARSQVNPMGYIFSTEGVERCSDNTYFFSHVDNSATKGRLRTVLATLKKQKRNINLLAIAITSQKSGMKLLQKHFQPVFKCKNPRTNRTLHLFYKNIVPKLTKPKPKLPAPPARVRRLKHEDL